MAKKRKLTTEEVIINEYYNGETDIRKISIKHKMKSEDIVIILEKNGIL